MQVEESQAELEKKQKQLETVQRDLDIIGDKLVDELEKRAELQHSKETFQAELEELSKSLFEEANGLVAQEARRRFEHEQREKHLESDLAKLKIQVALDQEQLKELKQTIHDLTAQIEAADREKEFVKNSSHHEGSILQSSELPPLAPDMSFLSISDFSGTIHSFDPVSFKEFKQMLVMIKDVKLSKVSTIPFFKHMVEEEIEPCLRFGSNRVNAKKLLDSVHTNSCYVQKLTPLPPINGTSEILFTDTGTQGGQSSRRSSIATSEASLREDSDVGLFPFSSSAPKIPPTASIFSKSFTERITNSWFGSAPANTANVQIANPSPDNCSTCGRHSQCKHQFKVTMDQEDVWYPICIFCRERLISVCDFYTFMRGLQAHVFRNRTDEDLFLECQNLRRRVFLAKSGIPEFSREARSHASSRIGTPSPTKRLELKQKYSNFLSESIGNSEKSLGSKRESGKSSRAESTVPGNYVVPEPGSRIDVLENVEIKQETLLEEPQELASAEMNVDPETIIPIVTERTEKAESQSTEERPVTPAAENIAIPPTSEE